MYISNVNERMSRKAESRVDRQEIREPAKGFRRRRKRVLHFTSDVDVMRFRGGQQVCRSLFFFFFFNRNGY